VPYGPRGHLSLLRALRQAAGERFYMVYFQKPGVAEAELERDVRATMRRVLIGASGDAPPGGRLSAVPPGDGGFLKKLGALQQRRLDCQVRVYLSSFLLEFFGLVMSG